MFKVEGCIRGRAQLLTVCNAELVLQSGNPAAVSEMRAPLLQGEGWCQTSSDLAAGVCLRHSHCQSGTAGWHLCKVQGFQPAVPAEDLVST